MYDEMATCPIDQYDPAEPDRELVSRYTEGECMLLARAVEAISGWPAMGYWADKMDKMEHGMMTGHGCWDVHIFNLLPDGRRLDIMGARETRPFNQEWRYCVKDLRRVRKVLDWEHMESEWGCSMEPDEYTYEVAEKLVEYIENELLDKFGRA